MNQEGKPWFLTLSLVNPHDAMFYNVLHKSAEQGLYINDVFGDQFGYFRHALVEASHSPDGAAGPRTQMLLYDLLERYPLPRLAARGRG